MSLNDNDTIFSIGYSSSGYLRPLPFNGDMTKGYAIKRSNLLWYYLPHQWAIIRGIPGPDAKENEDVRGSGPAPKFSDPFLLMYNFKYL